MSTYRRKRRNAIWMMLVLPLVGVVWFFVSIVFFVLNMTVNSEAGVSQVPVAENVETADVGGGIDAESILDEIDGGESMNDISGYMPHGSFLNVIKSFINRFLGIIALIGIPVTIVGLVRLLTLKNDDEVLENKGVKLETLPEGEKLYQNSLSDVFMLGWRALFTKVDRISRGENQIAGVILNVLNAVGVYLLYLGVSSGFTYFSSLIVILSLVSWILSIRLAILRLRDFGRPWYAIFAFLIPFYNIYLAFLLAFGIGDRGSNKFGRDSLLHQPKSNNNYWLVCIIGFLIMSFFTYYKANIIFENNLDESSFGQRMFERYGIDEMLEKYISDTEISDEGSI